MVVSSWKDETNAIAGTICEQKMECFRHAIIAYGFLHGCSGANFEAAKEQASDRVQGFILTSMAHR